MPRSSPGCGRPAPLSSARPISTSLPTASAPPTHGGASLAIPTTPAAARAVRAAARRLPPWPACLLGRSALIPAGPFGGPRRRGGGGGPNPRLGPIALIGHSPLAGRLTH